IPAAMVEKISEKTTMYEYARSGKYPIEKILPQVNQMVEGDLRAIRKGMKDASPVIRYWAATSMGINHPATLPLVRELQELSKDDEIAVQIAAAEALYRSGQVTLPQNILIRALKSDYEKTRLQALNVLFNFSEMDLHPVWPAIRSIIPADETNRNYDVRAARGLMKKYRVN